MRARTSHPTARSPARHVVVYLVGYALAGALGVGIGWVAAVQQNSAPHDVVFADQTTFLDFGRRTLGGGGVKVAGNVSGLLAGERAALRVQLKNPASRPITLRTLVVTAHDAHRRCRAKANLVVDNYDSRRHGAKRHVIRAHSTGYVTLGITLISDSTRNQNVCKNAVFPLEYTATATG